MEKEKLNVLIVEDSLAAAELIQDILDRIPYISVLGKTEVYDQAKSCIFDTEPDVVVLDIKIRGGNGIELLKEMKEKKLRTQVVMFSLYNEFRSQCMDFGSDYFLSKSTEFFKLREVMSEIWEKRELLN